MGIPGLHNIDDQRGAVFLRGNFGAVSGEGIYGGKGAPYLYCQGKAVKQVNQNKKARLVFNIEKMLKVLK